MASHRRPDDTAAGPRFVSRGTIDPASGEATAAPPPRPGAAEEAGEGGEKRVAEWEAVKAELEGERRRREEARRADAEKGGERSLFEVLEANKGECGPFHWSSG